MPEYRICPHCGRVIDLDDPRVKRLTSAQFAVWHSIQGNLANGQSMGVSRIAELSNVTPATASYHVKRLKCAGLITAIPKREGSRYKVYKAAA